MLHDACFATYPFGSAQSLVNTPANQFGLSSTPQWIGTRHLHCRPLGVCPQNLAHRGVQLHKMYLATNHAATLIICSLSLIGDSRFYLYFYIAMRSTNKLQVLWSKQEIEAVMLLAILIDEVMAVFVGIQWFSVYPRSLRYYHMETFFCHIMKRLTIIPLRLFDDCSFLISGMLWWYRGQEREYTNKERA